MTFELSSLSTAFGENRKLLEASSTCAMTVFGQTHAIPIALSRWLKQFAELFR